MSIVDMIVDVILTRCRCEQAGLLPTYAKLTMQLVHDVTDTLTLGPDTPKKKLTLSTQFFDSPDKTSIIVQPSSPSTTPPTIYRVSPQPMGSDPTHWVVILNIDLPRAKEIINSLSTYKRVTMYKYAMEREMVIHCMTLRESPKVYAA